MLFENHGFIKDKKRLVFIGNDEDLFNLLNSKNNDLSSFGEVVIPKALQELKVYGAEDIYGNIYEEDWAIKLSYGVKDISNEDFKQAFNAYKNNAKFYKTKNNNFIDFTDSSVKELFNMIDLLNLEKDLKNGISYIHKGKLSLVEEVLKNKESKYILLLLLKKYKCVKDDEIMQVLNYKNKRSIAYNTKRAEEKLLINREFREKFFELEENLLK